VASLGRSSVRYEAGLFREVEPDWRDTEGKLARLTGPGSIEHPSAQWLPDEAFNLSLQSGGDGTGETGPAARAYLRRFRLFPSATGFFTHVYVDPISKRPVKELPQTLKAALEMIRHDQHHHHHHPEKGTASEQK
jgi:hypothetical protein